MNSTFSAIIVIAPASSSIFSTISRNLIPGTKNEISERTEGVTGNGGICFKTEQKKCA